MNGINHTTLYKSSSLVAKRKQN